MFRTVHFRALALGLSVTCSVGPVRASDTFPEEIRAQLQLPAAPPCTLCHSSDEGGLDTVVTPFGVTLARLGLVATDENSLLAALQAAESQTVDSDFDGVADLDELRAGGDPNDGVDLPTPMTGCALRSIPIPMRSVLQDCAILSLTALVLAWTRRRQSRTNTRPDGGIS